jgi:hypothetical protein
MGLTWGISLQAGSGPRRGYLVVIDVGSLLAVDDRVTCSLACDDDQSRSMAGLQSRRALGVL